MCTVYCYLVLFTLKGSVATLPDKYEAAQCDRMGTNIVRASNGAVSYLCMPNGYKP